MPLQNRFSSRALQIAVLGASMLFARTGHAEEPFAECISRLQDTAREAGLSERLVDEVLAEVRFVPRVIELDRRQPEFTETFTNYLDKRVTTARILAGRALLVQYRSLLESLTREYGVPPQYLVAFWGLETNYGGFLGKMPVLDSLATLACDERRSAFFTTELLEALRLVEQVEIEPADMEGSWAGAVGQTQFMPSAYRRFAVDGDGDGRIDLWRSVPDALASAANFLSKLGWERGLRWGREVRLPRDFPYARAGRGNFQPLREWRQLGVRMADGSELPDAEVKAAVLVPAGHEGPAFLVYRNFNVIMGWNRSEFYAISVGHLADRINGAGQLHRPPPADARRLSIAEVTALQTRLNELGFEAGEPDGILGSGTRAAISRFQHANAMIADGYPDAAVLSALGVMAGDAPAAKP